jgi:uncharacterized protein involved in exopolysaccharide biosynthesis
MRSPQLKTSSKTDLSLRDVAAVLFRHKLLIFVTFLTVAAGTAIVTYLMPNEYESRMRILVKNTRTDVPITAERTSGLNGTAPETEVSENQINSEIELLNSKDLLNQVVKECDLTQKHPSFLQRLGLKETPQTTDAKVEEASEALAKSLTIEPVKKASIIEIKYTSSSPAKAALVLKKLRDLYLEKHLRLHRPPGTFEFFKTQADQAEKQLLDAEKQLSSFQQSMNVVSLAQQKEQTVQKLTETKSKLLEAEASLKEVSERIERVQQQLRTVQPRIVTQSRALPNQYSAERLNTMIVELQNRRTQLLTKFRPDDRLVKEIDQQIATTRAALQKAVRETAVEQSTDLNPLRQALESELARARVDHAGTKGRLQMLVGQVQQYETQLSKLEGITAEYEDFARKVKQAEDSYELYNKKQEEARIADELDQNKITNVSVAEEPVQPQLPSKPNRLLNLMLGIFLGILLSAGSVFSVELLRETINTPRELEALTGDPVLASLPKDRSARRALVVEKRRLSLPKPASPDAEFKWAAGE